MNIRSCISAELSEELLRDYWRRIAERFTVGLLRFIGRALVTRDPSNTFGILSASNTDYARSYAYRNYWRNMVNVNVAVFLRLYIRCVAYVDER